MTELAGVAIALSPKRRAGRTIPPCCTFTRRPLATRSGPSAPVIRRGHDRARTRPVVASEPHDDRRSRGPPRYVRPTGPSASSSPTPSTRTSTSRPTSAWRAPPRDRILHLGALAQPLVHRARRRPRRRAWRRRCRPRARTGRTRPSRGWAASRNASSSSWSRSVSPGKPTMNDERNAASGSAARMRSMQVEEAVAAPPPLHAPQQRRRRVLQREVEVGHDRRQLEHRRDERVAHLARDRGRGAARARQAVARRACRGVAAAARARRARRRRARTRRGPGRRARSRATPPSTRARTSASIDSGVRERCLPRNDGMAQKAQARSQPSATFT